MNGWMDGWMDEWMKLSYDIFDISACYTKFSNLI